MKRLWRWLTYKRVLIVFSVDSVATGDIVRLIGGMEYSQRINAVGLQTYGQSPAVSVFALDHLTQAEFDWVKAETDKLLEPPPAIMERGGALEYVDSFDKLRPGQVMSGSEVAIEAFRKGRYRADNSNPGQDMDFSNFAKQDIGKFDDAEGIDKDKTVIEKRPTVIDPKEPL